MIMWEAWVKTRRKNSQRRAWHHPGASGMYYLTKEEAQAACLAALPGVTIEELQANSWRRPGDAKGYVHPIGVEFEGLMKQRRLRASNKVLLTQKEKVDG